MKYEPGLPAHNPNVSHRRPGREFFGLALAASALLLSLVWFSGLAVDWAVARVDVATEQRLLRQLGEAMQPPASAPSAEQRALDALLQPLLECVDQPYEVELVVIDDPAPNAFAVPGGQIWLTRGLLEGGLSANGLAFVLGHELGHFANRDHLRGLGRSLVLWVLAESLLGYESGLSRLLAPSLSFGRARHAQADESAADITGLQVLQCRYGHVGGATELFEHLQRVHGDGLPALHYFESHPRLVERIASLRALAQRRGLRELAVEPMARAAAHAR